MEYIKESTQKKKLFLIITAVILIRFVFSIGILPFGFSLVSETQTSYIRFAVMAVFAVAFSVLAAAVLLKIYEKFGEASLFICALILSDSLLFNTHINSVKLIIVCLGLVCVLNAFAKKQVIKSEIILPIYTLISTILIPQTGLSISLTVFFLYIIANADSFKKNKSKLLTPLAIIISSAIGVVTNIKVISKLQDISFFEEIFYKSDYKFNANTQIITPFTVLIFIPSLTLGIWFLSIFIKKDSKGSFSNASVDATVITYAAAAVGFFVFKNTDSFFTVNLFVPALILLLNYKNVPAAKKALDKMNTYIKNHSFVFTLIYILIIFTSITLTTKLLPIYSFYNGIDWTH